MRIARQCPTVLLCLTLLLNGCRTSQAGRLTTLNAPQGGVIVFGPVSGVSTQAQAMGKILRSVHESCGERPVLGRVFRFKGTDMVGVFFSAVNHPAGNKRVAGMVIALPADAQGVEAALVTDDATHFGKSVNPMLQQLYGAWKPGGSVTNAGPRPSGAIPPLRQVVLPDSSATVSLPEGWRLAPPSGGGYMNILGPSGEILQFFGSITACDPNHPLVRQTRRFAGASVYCPYGGDLARAFVTIYQQHQRNQRLPVTEFRITRSEPAASTAGNRTVHIMGQAKLARQSEPAEFEALHYEMPPMSGIYYSVFFVSYIPQHLANRQRATVHAILGSYAVNMQVVNAQAARNAAPAIAAIQQVGRNAAAFSAANNAANDAQHAGYWSRQDANARTSQGFHNYLLDQTVVQDNNMYGNGTVGHGTAWNATADTLVRADPGRFELVGSSNYMKGVDY